MSWWPIALVPSECQTCPWTYQLVPSTLVPAANLMREQFTDQVLWYLCSTSAVGFLVWVWINFGLGLALFIYFCWWWCFLRLLRAVSSWVLVQVLHPWISKDGDCTTCLGSLFQWLPIYILFFFLPNSLVSPSFHCLLLCYCQSPGTWREECTSFLHKSVLASLIWVRKGFWRDSY